jgi:type II secretory pathway component PulF
MSRFRYQALNADGQVVTGVLEADGVQEAVTQLQAQGLSVQSIGFAAPDGPLPSESAPSRTTAAGRQAGRLPRRPDGESVEQAVLRTHMATILERGHAIAPALSAYAEEMPAGWQRRQLIGVCRILERGDPNEAAAALSELPECWIPLLSAATSSSDLSDVLREFLTESQRTDDLRQKWWLTIAYPLILLGLATVVMTALSIFVIPEFRTIFADFGLELPSFTLLVLNVASFLSRWGVLLLICLGLLFAMLVLNAYRLLPESALSWLGDWFRAPFGRRAAVARFARFMADLLEAGVSVPDSLRIAGFTVNQSRMQYAAWRLANDIESTGGFSQRAYQRPLTATIAYALATDSAQGSPVRLLREISNCHAERVRIGLSWTTGIFEPIAICVVGIVVGCAVLGLFLPLVTLIEGLSN